MEHFVFFSNNAFPPSNVLCYSDFVNLTRFPSIHVYMQVIIASAPTGSDNSVRETLSGLAPQKQGAERAPDSPFQIFFCGLHHCSFFTWSLCRFFSAKLFFTFSFESPSSPHSKTGVCSIRGARFSLGGCGAACQCGDEVCYPQIRASQPYSCPSQQRQVTDSEFILMSHLGFSV